MQYDLLYQQQLGVLFTHSAVTSAAVGVGTEKQGGLPEWIG